MKKSSEYSIGDSVTSEEQVLTKKSDKEIVPDGVPGLVEIWTSQDGLEYTPTLSFELGLSAPEFNHIGI